MYIFAELVALLGRDAKNKEITERVCVSLCARIPEGWEGRLGQMVHKGVITQWVGTAIDALQHPRRWNIWLLTRSQNSLARPSPYLAAMREPTGDLVGINTHSESSTFPPSREPARAIRWKTSPSSLQGGHDGGAGREDECTEPWRWTKTAHWNLGLLCYTWMEKIWPWA